MWSFTYAGSLSESIVISDDLNSFIYLPTLTNGTVTYLLGTFQMNLVNNTDQAGNVTNSYNIVIQTFGINFTCSMEDIEPTKGIFGAAVSGPVLDLEQFAASLFP